MSNSPGVYAPVQNSSTPDLLSSRAPAGLPQARRRQGSLSSMSSGSVNRAPFAARPSPRGSYAASEDSRYALPGRDRPSSLNPSISEKFHLAPDPTEWGLDISHAEADDALHDPRDDHNTHNILTGRGLQNVGCIVLLCLCIVGLFLGYPVAHHFMNPVTFSVLHVNSTGQMPKMGNWGLIDLDTPKDALNIHAYHDPSQTLQLVFSDEFEMDGRSFYPGDDPYWEAADLHYWQTGNLEWYDPSAVYTKGGALELNLSKVDDPSTNHNLSYKGGMLSTWNKFCFTGGLIVANVMLPGINNVFGLWPAVWTMGNLGRAGYGASLDGMWPYVYDACDVGTMPNQTLNGGPPAALHSGDDNGETTFGELSFLPGQRLSRCTCPGESHPGPIHSDGTYVGRSAPEIDILEAQIGGPDGAHVGQVSQSAQWAPFNKAYDWNNSTDNMFIADSSLSRQNSFSGGVFQQATSVVSTTNQGCYQLLDQCYAVQGFEYVPGYGDAYITWITDNKVSWTLKADGVGADLDTGIAARPITDEPMYIIANLGISHAFGFVDFEHLVFPSIMRIDWVRVYQHPDKINIGCDTPEKPTSAYINTYIEAYTNPLLTTWEDDYHQPIPKNKLKDAC
ncbi:beta-glucan synthesis-associated [Mycena albidolilacea]|uniref:Beta-glucan synthesis-associated n=1 Tax=Mycena albidolilacea TaxID=1033008 RepID=A0AAD6ZB49_9AGAR|nr:beta-glucan synthesis-associated [Mycena albidolilacea]